MGTRVHEADGDTAGSILNSLKLKFIAAVSPAIDPTHVFESAAGSRKVLSSLTLPAG